MSTTTETADANPSKSFFISMLTRDIGLADCILDLLDNSVDGIVANADRNGVSLPAENRYLGFAVQVHFNEHSFTIADHSGGIPIQVAKEYAFRFGRPDEAPDLTDGSIGLYGIGMKRAVFKMGNKINLVSSTGAESFVLDFNVDEWRKDSAKDWTFSMTNVIRNNTTVPVGTTITVTDLYAPISREFKNPHFLSTLKRIIARDYAFILAQQLTVSVNGDSIGGLLPNFRESDDLEPYRHTEVFDGVSIEITAGLADPPPDDTSARAKHPEVELYGWYVVCNERVVVTADKTALTGWGRRPVSSWHPQYIGFMGVARFDSADPRKLPWKTTKRDVESSSPVYQHALNLMMEAAKAFVDYTNERRAEAKRARRMERQAAKKPVQRVQRSNDYKFPQLIKSDVVVVSYERVRTDIDSAANALKIAGASPAEVGAATFQYFFDREVLR